ncbi:MAG: hypothetical protein H6693_04875 [Candidatus Latescibacteria bacterium]|nr:hypothetical protein [Candidatus Latescibacterota bacterium]MCB9515503.1 hypothetical protein [Candidatus Latescibacterota bacterium]
MTPARLYLLALLCLVLAGVLLFGVTESLATNTVAGIAVVLALVAYLLGIYLSRVGRRGEEALTALRSRIASVSDEAIQGEYRTYHLAGLDELPRGELLVIYGTRDGWLLVPLLDELAWMKVPDCAVGSVSLEREGGLHLRAVMRSESGRDLDLRLASTLADPKSDSDGARRDLEALRDALRGQPAEV